MCAGGYSDVMCMHTLVLSVVTAREDVGLLQPQVRGCCDKYLCCMYDCTRAREGGYQRARVSNIYQTINYFLVHPSIEIGSATG